MDLIRPEKFFLRSFNPVVVNRWRFGSGRRRTLEPERKGIQGSLFLAACARENLSGHRSKVADNRNRALFLALKATQFFGILVSSDRRGRRWSLCRPGSGTLQSGATEKGPPNRAPGTPGNPAGYPGRA